MQYFQGKLYGDKALLDKIPTKLRELFDNKYGELLNEKSEYQEISEAYHADKAAGKETKLTKAVEALLGKPQESATPAGDVEAKKADIKKRKETFDKNSESLVNRQKNELAELNKKLKTDYQDTFEILNINEYSTDKNVRSKEAIELANRHDAEFKELNKELAGIEDDATTVDAPILTNEQSEKRKNIFEKLKVEWKKLSSKDSKTRADLDDGMLVDWTEAEKAGGDYIGAHGMGKSSLASALNDLFELMNNGINPVRGNGRLDTAPLTSSTGISAGTTAGGVAYRDGAFILLSSNGSLDSISDIGGIVVNDAVATTEVLSLLREAFPNLVIESYSNSAKAVAKLTNIAEIEKGRQEEIDNYKTTVKSEEDYTEQDAYNFMSLTEQRLAEGKITREKRDEIKSIIQGLLKDDASAKQYIRPLDLVNDLMFAEEEINTRYDAKLTELDNVDVIIQSNNSGIKTIKNVTFGTASKQGLTESNEDALYVNVEKGIFILADGMGGEGMITLSPAQASKLVINQLLGKKEKSITELLYDEYLKNPDITHDQVLDFLSKNGINLTGASRTIPSKITNAFRTEEDLSNRKGFKSGATALKAIRKSKNTYEIEKVGDTVFFVVDKNGNVTQQHGISDVSTTQGYMFSVKDGKPYANTPKTDNFIITLNEGETIVFATDFLETEKSIQDFINSNFGEDLDFAKFQKENKQDDSTFITIKYDAPASEAEILKDVEEYSLSEASIKYLFYKHISPLKDNLVVARIIMELENFLVKRMNLNGKPLITGNTIIGSSASSIKELVKKSYQLYEAWKDGKITEGDYQEAYQKLGKFYGQAKLIDSIRELIKNNETVLIPELISHLEFSEEKIILEDAIKSLNFANRNINNIPDSNVDAYLEESLKLSDDTINIINSTLKALNNFVSSIEAKPQKDAFEKDYSQIRENIITRLQQLVSLIPDEELRRQANSIIELKLEEVKENVDRELKSVQSTLKAVDNTMTSENNMIPQFKNTDNQQSLSLDAKSLIENLSGSDKTNWINMLNNQLPVATATKNRKSLINNLAILAKGVDTNLFNEVVNFATKKTEDNKICKI